MKAFAIIFILATSVCASAQTASAPTQPAGIKIIRVGLQRTTAKGPQVRAVASTDFDSQIQAQADKNREVDRNPALHRMSKDAEVAPVSSSAAPFGNLSVGTPVIFVASIVVKNIGAKTVTAVDWEYLMFETGGKQPVKRYRVHSKKTILPGDQLELTKEVDPKGKEQQALISRLEYSDGSIWQQPK